MNKKQKIIYFYFIILPFIDLITSLITRFTKIPLSLGMLVKGITLIISILYIFFLSKSKYRKKSIYYLIILFLFGIMYIITKRDIWQLRLLANEITYAFRYFYFPIMLCGLINIFEDFKINNKLIKKIILINCISYVFLLLIPYITGTGFKSYRYSEMYGMNGWFYAANETGAIMIILSSCILDLLDDNKKYKITFIIPMLLSISLLGTKVSYLGLILIILIICIMYIIKHKNDNYKVNKYILPMFLLFILGGVSLISPTITNLEGRIEDVNNPEVEVNKSEELSEKKEKLNLKYETIEDLIPNKKLSKLFTVALNGRVDFFLKNYSIYSEVGIINQLFGLSWSNRPNLNYTIDKKLIEIDYLDIFIHYGMIGFIIYFLPLLYVLIKVITKRKIINVDTLFYIILLLLMLGISSFTGHILAAPSVSIYLILIMLIIINDIEEKKKLNENEITILALHLGVGGIEKYISSLCKMLQDNYRINIITTYKINDKPAFDFDDRINITYLIEKSANKTEFMNAIKEKNIKSIFKEGLKSIKILYLKETKNRKAIKNINSKYIITTRDFHSKLVGIYANKNIIKIATEHNYHNSNKKYINKVIKSIKNFNYFVVVSENLKKYYQDKIGTTKCIYIPNVIEELPQKKSNLKENNLINIGRLEEVKGQLDLIEIVKEIKKEIKDIKLYLIGDGTLRNLIEQKIKEYSLEDNVLLTGFLSPKEMEPYLTKSKLFVMTSYTESFGLVLIEAMSYGIPCIAFDNADGAKTLLKNEVGILIKNRNINEMANRIVKILKNEKKIREYSQKGITKCQNYLSTNVKKQWLTLLNGR